MSIACVNSVFMPSANGRLYVEQVEAWDFPSMVKISKQWESIAEIKKNQASTEREQAVFENCKTLSCCVSNCIRSAAGDMYLCTDKRGSPQGLLYVSDYRSKFLNIDLLMASPLKVSGVGVYLLKKAEEIAVKRGWEKIVVEVVLAGSEGFYLKNGFTKMGPDKLYMMEKGVGKGQFSPFVSKL